MRRFIASVGTLSAEQLLRTLTNFFVAIWLTRYLGPSEYGTYTYVISIVTIFSVIGRLGLNEIVVQELFRSDGRSLGSVLLLKLIFGCCAYLFLIAISYFIIGDLAIRDFLLIAGFCIIFQIGDPLEYYLQAKKMFVNIAFAKSIQNIVSNAVKLYLIATNSGIEMFFISFALDYLFLLIFYIFIIRKYNSLVVYSFDFQRIKYLAKKSIPFAFINLASILIIKIDQLAIYNIIGSIEAGAYGAAVRLSEAWFFFIVLIISVSYPSLLSSSKKNKEDFNRILKKTIFFMVSISLIVAILISLLSGVIIKLLYGNVYVDAGSPGVLMIHIWCGVLISIEKIAQKWMAIENKTVGMLRRSILSVVFCVFANFVGVYFFGIYGGALATVSSLIFLSFLVISLDKNTRDFFVLLISAFKYSYIKSIIILRRDSNG